MLQHARCCCRHHDSEADDCKLFLELECRDDLRCNTCTALLLLHADILGECAPTSDCNIFNAKCAEALSLNIVLQALLLPRVGMRMLHALCTGSAKHTCTGCHDRVPPYNSLIEVKVSGIIQVFHKDRQDMQVLYKDCHKHAILHDCLREVTMSTGKTVEVLLYEVSLSVLSVPQY